MNSDFDIVDFGNNIYILRRPYNFYFNICEICHEIIFVLQNIIILKFFLYHIITDIQYQISL